MSKFLGMGTGGGGGGSFRTVSRVARAGLNNLQDLSSPSSSSSSSSSKRGVILCNRATAIPSASVSLSNSTLFPPPWPLSSSSSTLCDDDSEWVCVHDHEDGNDSFDACVFGSAPSPSEVTAALLSLQQALPTSCTSDFDWIEPSMHMYGYDQRISGIGSVYDALNLLQTDPSVQRMVISLSSDRAVWDAVLNNEAVQEIRESFYRGEENNSETSGEESNPRMASANALCWIFDNMRAKFMEFLAGITNLIKEALQSPDHQQQTWLSDGFGEKVRVVFMLTSIVLLIVVMSRASHG